MDNLQTLWLFELLSKKEDCYKLLSLLHQNYTAIMGRFKDYISAPKKWISIITYRIDRAKKTKIEIQIRTFEMDEFAENGVAAHWMYKNGAKFKEGIKFKWVRELPNN